MNSVVWWGLEAEGCIVVRVLYHGGRLVEECEGWAKSPKMPEGGGEGEYVRSSRDCLVQGQFVGAGMICQQTDDLSTNRVFVRAGMICKNSAYYPCPTCFILCHPVDSYKSSDFE